RYALDAVATEARPGGAGWILAGEKHSVLHGAAADRLLVSARTPRGLSLFLVERGAPGLAVSDYPQYDGQRAATIRLDQVRVDAGALLGGEGAAAEAIEYTIDAAIAAVCAEAVGAMGALLEATGQ